MKFVLRILWLVLALLATTMQAAPIGFYAVLSGAAEVPVNASPGTGYASVVIDPVAHTLYVSISFSNLIGTTTASHIHVVTTGDPATSTGPVATQTPSFTGFPLGVTSGSFSNTYDLTLSSTYRAGFITDSGGIAAAEAALIQGIVDGRAYVNVHTDVFPGGEIRGMLEPVPEPTAVSLVSVALVGLGLTRYRRRVSR